MRCNFNRRSAHETCVREVRAAFPNRWPNWATSDNRPWFVWAFMWRIAVSWERCDRWRVLGLRVRPGDKTAIVTMEGSHVSATKVEAPGTKQNEGNVNGVFWFWGYRTPRVRSRRANNNKEFYVEVLRRLCESVRRKDRKNDGMATGSCTAAMRPHTLHILCSCFWANTAPLSCSSRHTHQISHRVTFSCSQGLRKFWKDTDLRHRRTSNEIRRRHY